VPPAFKIGRADFGAREKFRAGAAQRDETVDHDVAAMREFQRVIGVLLDDQHGEAVLAIECADGVKDLPCDERREAERGLVQHQETGAAHQRAADGQHLLLAAGQRAAALRDTFLEAGKQREDTFETGIALGVGALGGGVRAHAQVFSHGHARENAPSFGRLRDTQPGDVMGRLKGDVAAVERDGSGARAGPAEHRHHECGLARAVGSDQRHDLARVDIEIDALERFDIAIGRDEATDGKEGCRAHVPPSMTSMAVCSSAPR